MEFQTKINSENWLSELMREVTTFGYTKTRNGIGNESYEYDIIRVAQYEKYGNDMEECYIKYIQSIVEKVLEEFQLLPNGPDFQSSLELTLARERLMQAFIVITLHSMSFDRNEFDSAKFERAFYPFFPNHPALYSVPHSLYHYSGKRNG
jgi:hypothetical protein